MSTLSPSNSEHEHLIGQLPWLVNGTLKQAEADQLKQHINGCEYCQNELVSLSRMQRHLAEAHREIPDTSASFERMRRRLAEDTPPSSLLSECWHFVQSVGGFFDIGQVRGWSIAAVCGLAVLMIMVQPNSSIDQTNDNPYEVLSSDELQGDMQLLVELDSGLTSDQASMLLHEIAQLESVSSASFGSTDDTIRFFVDDSQSESLLSPVALSQLIERLKRRQGVVEVRVLP